MANRSPPAILKMDSIAVLPRPQVTAIPMDGGWSGRAPRELGQVRKEAAAAASAWVDFQSPIPFLHAVRPMQEDAVEDRPSEDVTGLDASVQDSSFKSYGDMDTRGEDAAYEVLARRYRPLGFDGVIGQDALVRTLRNSFEADRIAHAFVLTGVRGVGKTTTARIIARCLNCTGAGDKPTFSPCGTCNACRGIAESRYADVVELDAASHTQVDKIRELIEGASFRPKWGRYKVYIIDEAHMLSTASFNALLKTLEEPPAHAIFILATTEVKKIPLTVLSRCQRFDLRRVDTEALANHLKLVAKKEGIEIDSDAVSLLVRAAAGSVRDALSMLDQAIAYGGKRIDVDGCRSMLGLADGQRVLDLFERICAGDVRGALTEFESQYQAGAESAAVLGALAEVCHRITVLRVAPEAEGHAEESLDAVDRQRSLARRLETPALVRLWQVLDHSIEEVRRADREKLSADMAIIRLTHVSQLPTPDEIAQRLEGEGDVNLPPSGQSSPKPAKPPTPDTREGIAKLASDHGELRLAHAVKELDIVKLELGTLVYAPSGSSQEPLIHNLGSLLKEWTGQEWKVLAEARDAEGSQDQSKDAGTDDDRSSAVAREFQTRDRSADVPTEQHSGPSESQGGGIKDLPDHLKKELEVMLPSGTSFSVVPKAEDAAGSNEEKQE